MQHTMAAKEDSLALQGICCRSPYDILSYDADITTGLPFQDTALMGGSCQRKHCIMERLPEVCCLHHGHSVSGYLYSEVCTFAGLPACSRDPTHVHLSGVITHLGISEIGRLHAPNCQSSMIHFRD